MFLTQESSAAKCVSFLGWATFGRSQTLRDSGVAWFSSEHELTPPWAPLPNCNVWGTAKSSKENPAQSCAAFPTD